MGHVALAVVFTICVFLVATLFFSVNIITLRSFSRARLQEAFKLTYPNNGVDQWLDGLSNNVEKLVLTVGWYRQTCQIVTLVLFLALFNMMFPARLLLGYGCALVSSTLLTSIFGLAIPHAWSKYAGEKVFCRSYKLLLLLAVAATPIFYLQRWYDGLVRRMIGVAETTPEEQLEERHEEFLSELEQHRMDGAVDEEEQEMIENVLELSESTADEIMTPRTDLVAVALNSDLQAVLKIIEQAGHSRLPVYEENIDNIVGFIYAKDLLAEIGQDPQGFKLKDKLRPAYFVPESKSLRALLHEFQAQKLHVAVVLDEYGGTAGIVTMEDILEELVGEIQDEYEKTESLSITEIDAHTFELDARTYVDDLNDLYELDLPEDEDYDTVGGFVFTQLGYIPKTGETFEYKNLTFTILSAEARRINRIRIVCSV